MPETAASEPARAVSDMTAGMHEDGSMLATLAWTWPAAFGEAAGKRTEPAVSKALGRRRQG
jgi:hypothetical protein